MKYLTFTLIGLVILFQVFTYWKLSNLEKRFNADSNLFHQLSDNQWQGFLSLFNQAYELKK